MGLCGSAEETLPSGPTTKGSRDLDKQIQNSALADSRVTKLLLLGAGASGKSTMFKQMILMYGRGFDENDIRMFKINIHHNVIASMQTLLRESPKYGNVAMENKECIAPILNLRPESSALTPSIGELMSRLWGDSVIKTTYEKSARFHNRDLPEAAAYFFDKIKEVCALTYSPNEQDTLRCRVPTTGIVEYAFNIDENSFKLFDLGGQRSERKKWVHCFERVTAVLFVAAINEYDQVLFEDERMNRLREALDLFEGVINNEWFYNTSTILFLNKRDLFLEKIPKVPLSDYFPEFTGDNSSFDETTRFIKEMFMSKNHSDKKIYAHITCATDRQNVRLVFEDVKDIVIKGRVKRAGLE